MVCCFASGCPFHLLGSRGVRSEEVVDVAFTSARFVRRGKRDFESVTTGKLNWRQIRGPVSGAYHMQDIAHMILARHGGNARVT
jgi:hypothetical protein